LLKVQFVQQIFLTQKKILAWEVHRSIYRSYWRIKSFHVKLSCVLHGCLYWLWQNVWHRNLYALSKVKNCIKHNFIYFIKQQILWFITLPVKTLGKQLWEINYILIRAQFSFVLSYGYIHFYILLRCCASNLLPIIYFLSLSDEASWIFLPCESAR